MSAQPQFADKCTDKIYDEFSQGTWEELEAKHPGVFEEKRSFFKSRMLRKDQLVQVVEVEIR